MPTATSCHIHCTHSNLQHSPIIFHTCSHGHLTPGASTPLFTLFLFHTHALAHTHTHLHTTHTLCSGRARNNHNQRMAYAVAWRGSVAVSWRVARQRRISITRNQQQRISSSVAYQNRRNGKTLRNAAAAIKQRKLGKSAPWRRGMASAARKRHRAVTWRSCVSSIMA